MRMSIVGFLVLALVLGGTNLVLAQGASAEHASIVVPASSVEQSGDRGVRAHTNHLIRTNGRKTTSSPKGETPSSIRAVYNLSSSMTAGGSQTIAIVDAYHYPTAASDLNTFAKQFGLPPMPDCSTTSNVGPCFSVVFASGSQPNTNCGWAQEAALDIEWAHAMAPQARIVLVEARSNSYADLFTAVDVATSIVTSGGGQGEISMSWSGSEFSSESSYDGHFSGNSNVVYFAASGDTGGVNGYPSVSPYVTSAGGTRINRSSSGAFLGETAWSGSGGGPSAYETKLAYQNNVPGTSATQRSAPDISFDADPNSGVSVYDSTSCQGLSGWLVFGGTSVSSPALAGIINSASTANVNFAASTVDELMRIYTNYTNASWYRDITSGSAGNNVAKSGYDYVTGVGSSLTLSGK